MELRDHVILFPRVISLRTEWFKYFFDHLGVDLKPFSCFKALFFLILAICGNFLAETLSCQTQKMFKHMYAKHVYQDGINAFKWLMTRDILIYCYTNIRCFFAGDNYIYVVDAHRRVQH